MQSSRTIVQVQIGKSQATKQETHTFSIFLGPKPKQDYEASTFTQSLFGIVFKINC